MENKTLQLTPDQAEALTKAVYFTLNACFDIDKLKYRGHAMSVLKLTSSQVDEQMMLHAQLTVDFELQTKN